MPCQFCKSCGKFVVFPAMRGNSAQGKISQLMLPLSVPQKHKVAYVVFRKLASVSGERAPPIKGRALLTSPVFLTCLRFFPEPTKQAPDAGDTETPARTGEVADQVIRLCAVDCVIDIFHYTGYASIYATLKKPALLLLSVCLGGFSAKHRSVMGRERVPTLFS